MCGSPQTGVHKEYHPYIICVVWTSNNRVIMARARPIRFFWADTDIFVLLKQYLFCFMRQNKHPGAILPSAKHFQTAAKRHSRAFFSSDHINKENNFTSYNYFMRQNIHCCFALWGKIYTPGAILPPAEHDWLNWSHDKFGQHNCLSWLWHLFMGQSDRQVMLCFQCWQAASSFLLALCEL